MCSCFPLKDGKTKGMVGFSVNVIFDGSGEFSLSRFSGLVWFRVGNNSFDLPLLFIVNIRLIMWFRFSCSY